MTNIKYGFLIYNLVRFSKIWCIICAKARWHEIYGGWAACMACTETSPEQIDNTMITEQSRIPLGYEGAYERKN